MFRLKHYWRRFFISASLLRTYTETLSLFSLLILITLLVYQTNVDGIINTSLVFFINPCSALYYSLRLGIRDGHWHERIAFDLLAITVPILLFNPLVWFMMRTYPNHFFMNIHTDDWLFIALMVFPYLFFRTGISLFVWWNKVRQRRIIWSLLSSIFISVALLQITILLTLSIVLFFSNFNTDPLAQIPDNLLAWLLYRLQASLPMVGAATLAATLILIALIPASIIVSYFFARKLRQRLDVLVDATHNARDGNYDVQIVVNGQDEIAQLQADFNVMIVNLNITMHELREEREKVAKLLDSRRELMANVSHELRTPIATVRAYLESANQQQETESSVILPQNDLAVIQREILLLQTLIDDLFALSKAEVDQLAMQLVPVDVTRLIHKVVEAGAGTMWRVKKVELVAKLPAAISTITADEVRLEQVLRNLIQNSLRYTPPGGLILIQADETDQYVEIQVRDTGEGIQLEHLPHIWERYYHDAEQGDSGLGLALVKSFIETMHGQVEVTSIRGEGTCFIIKLPITNTSKIK